MHIVIDARESGTSTGRYIDKLIQYLHGMDTGHTFTIITTPARLDYMRRIAPKFQLVSSEFKAFTLAEQTGFKKQLELLKPDLVHFGMSQQPAWYKGKTVTTIHDLTTTRFRDPTKNKLIFSIKQMVYSWLVRRVAKKSITVIVPSQYVKSDVVDFAGIIPDKVVVTYEAADVIEDTPEVIPAFKGKQYIMYNGRPFPHKNLQRLIEAFAEIHKLYPDLYLMIAGKSDATYGSYVGLAQQLGVGDYVVLTDWITDGQLKWAMENTAAYIYPSLSEGFGLPPLEAMTYGAPVVASNATCIPEVCGDAAWYFDPYSVKDMVRAISEVLKNRPLQGDLIAKGQDQVKKYSWQRMAEQTLEVYENALKAETT